ncbi:MAG: hypothetical protein AAGI23_21140 [Bacteroidota bacterium]
MQIRIKPKIDIEFPALIYAFRHHDNPELAIPFDIEEINDYAFFIKEIEEDRMKIILEDVSGKTILLKQRGFRIVK